LLGRSILAARTILDFDTDRLTFTGDSFEDSTVVGTVIGFTADGVFEFVYNRASSLLLSPLRPEIKANFAK